MRRLLYEHSLSDSGYLIIPFVFNQIAQSTIYTYALLSQRDHRGKFHQQENPAGLRSESLVGILKIAKGHLALYGDDRDERDYFQDRYVYQNHMVITHQQSGKCYYDHYPPEKLRNIAAPRLFASPQDCLRWVQRGLDRQRSLLT